MRAEKMQRWVIEAAKQCGRNVLMEVHDPIDWCDFLDLFAPTPLRLLADPSGVPLSSVICQPPGSDVVLAVGPEGGFTDEELQAAEGGGWTLISLGQRILRVETAGVALIARIVGDR
jgi:16S rRNA (uracil1498-N3)-methyltransferase